MKKALLLFSLFGLMTITRCAPTDIKEVALDGNNDEDFDKELLRMMADDDDDDDLHVMNDDDDNSDDLIRMMADDDDDDLQEFARFMALLEGHDKNRNKHDKEDVEVEETADENKESEGKEENNEELAQAEDKDMAVTQGWRFWRRKFRNMRRRFFRLRRKFRRMRRFC